VHEAKNLIMSLQFSLYISYNPQLNTELVLFVQMLLTGCSSGAVSIELTFLLPLMSGLLGFNIDVAANDAKVT
jgi:hypothetical protein